MKAKMILIDAELEDLTIRRTRKEEVLLVLKKRGEVLAFEKALGQAVGAKADVWALFSNNWVEVAILSRS